VKGITRLLVLATICGLGPATLAARQYAVSGMVVAVDQVHHTFTASIQSIPDFMPAMVMPFEVQQPRELDRLAPGAMVEFTLVVEQKTSYAEHIRVLRYQSVDQDPLSASRLKLLNQLTSGTSASSAIVPGMPVPDFTLLDQKRQMISISQLRGKVVAVNFIYTSCALPNLCLRIANNFAVLQQRFKAQLGRDLVLLTVTFDPAHDTPEVLAGYAKQWNADESTWHFLTGLPKDVKRVCAMFDVDSFQDEGLMNHSLHTALIDRQGKLITNIEGNQFTATQLADLTAVALK
jgi:protein SCO1/2